MILNMSQKFPITAHCCQRDNYVAWISCDFVILSSTCVFVLIKIIYGKCQLQCFPPTFCRDEDRFCSIFFLLENCKLFMFPGWYKHKLQNPHEAHAAVNSWIRMIFHISRTGNHEGLLEYNIGLEVKKMSTLNSAEIIRKHKLIYKSQLLFTTFVLKRPCCFNFF